MAFWLYFGVAMLLETPRQIERDQEFIETQIKPSVNFIKDFKTKNGSLPNNREYYVWQREFHKDYSSDLTQKVDTLIPGLGIPILQLEFGVANGLHIIFLGRTVMIQMIAHGLVRF